MSAPCPSCGGMREVDGKSCSCGWRSGKAAKPAADTSCRWLDASGDACGSPGSIRDATGKWMCSDHYCLSKGGQVSRSPQPSYRERWYAEKGLEYQPPKSGNLASAMPKRQRQPGDDSDEDIGHEAATA